MRPLEAPRRADVRQAWAHSMSSASTLMSVETPVRLLDMSEDEQRVIADALCNPLNPRVAMGLCSTCQSLRRLMHAQLVQLRDRHRAVAPTWCRRLARSDAAGAV